MGMILRDSKARRYLVHVVGRTSAREIARRMRVHPSAVSRWLSGETVPDEKRQKALFQTYGIPEAW